MWILYILTTVVFYGSNVHNPPNSRSIKTDMIKTQTTMVHTQEHKSKASCESARDKLSSVIGVRAYCLEK